MLERILALKKYSLIKGLFLFKPRASLILFSKTTPPFK